MAKEYGLAASALSGAKAPTKSPAPKTKTIKEMRHRATKNGGYVVEHHHHEDHPMEEHVMPDQDSLMEHMGANQPQAAPEAAEQVPQVE